jgi:hypothetical protein
VALVDIHRWGTQNQGGHTTDSWVDQEEVQEEVHREDQVEAEVHEEVHD